jgi:peptide/nickel transport system substrate-binding protein
MRIDYQRRRKIMKKRFISLQASKLTAGHIDRRQFVMSALAAGVVLPSALTMADKAMAATPNKGGTLRYGTGFGSTTDSLDSGTFENSMTTNIGMSFGNHLTEIGSDGQLRPELAESYESSYAKTWVVNLRQGVEFHNGKTLTADDVVATFDYHRGEDSKSAAKGLLSAVVSIKADGPNRVIMELDAPNAGFPYIVSDYHLLIKPSTDGKIDSQSGIGTGGYVLQNFEPGVRATFKRNANYWKEGAAHFDEVEMVSLVDTTARQNAVMNGDVDAIDRVDPKTVALLGRVPTLEILEVAGTLHYTFPMRVTSEPFDHRDLRLALKHSLKRHELVDKILLGHGSLGNDHPISTANPFHASDLPQREFNPEKAMEHYKASGHSGTIQLSASDAAFAGAVDAAQLIAASAKEVGIDIEVVREPSDGYWSNVWNKKPWCACYWGGRPTEDWMYSSAYVDDTEWNDTDWRTTDDAVKFNGIVKEARAELDVDKRRAMYAETQQLISDDGGAVVPMFANHIHANNKKIAHHEDVAGNWSSDGGKYAERWWFA